MAKSDARFDYRAKLARQDHDLSRPFLFTCPPGQELPIFTDFATPGDSYYITHDLTYLRTAPLAQPAMVDVKCHFETFFVPMQMIYEPFENSEFMINHVRSSFYDITNLSNINLPLFNYSQYINYIKDEYTTHSLRLQAFRLADLLGLNPFNFAADANNSPQHDFKPNFFPWKLLAYHTIFNNYYRLDDKSQYDNTISNWDKYYDRNQLAVTAPTNFMGIHHRPWRFDYFMSMYRSPIVSSANMQEILPRGGYTDLLSSSFETTSVNVNGVITSSNLSKSAFTSPINYENINPLGSGAISTALIRQMFANEKLAMITGRARKTYDAQVLAHYGFDVPHDVKHDLSLIGRSTFDIHIGEVTSLASTSDAPLGELAGKGWSEGKGEQFKFTAPCHGVIMTLFCVEPLQRYVGGFSRDNDIRDITHFPIPEFDRLGNMAMFRFEVGPGPLNSAQNDIIGWKERYYQFKRGIPKATVAFEQASAQSAYLTNNYAAFAVANRPFDQSSRLPSTPRPDLEDSFYILENAVDKLMLVSYYDGWKVGSDDDSENWNQTPWLAYARDPFIVDSYIKCKKVSWMSKDGEPVYPF